MTVNWSGILTIVNLLLIVAGAVGAYIVLRSGISRASLEVQERVRTALLDENTLLNNRVNRVEKDNQQLKEDDQQLKELLSTMISALKQQHGLIVTIDGDLVTIKDTQRAISSTHISRTSRAKKTEG